MSEILIDGIPAEVSEPEQIGVEIPLTWPDNHPVPDFVAGQWCRVHQFGHLTFIGFARQVDFLGDKMLMISTGDIEPPTKVFLVSFTSIFRIDVITRDQVLRERESVTSYDDDPEESSSGDE